MKCTTTLTAFPDGRSQVIKSGPAPMKLPLRLVSDLATPIDATHSHRPAHDQRLPSDRQSTSSSSTHARRSFFRSASPSPSTQLTPNQSGVEHAFLVEADATSSIEVALQTYGHLCEGLSKSDTTSSEQHQRLKTQYASRRRLADLSTMPEGTSLTHALCNGSSRSFHLLTPPEMVAIRRRDGTWYRTRRVEHIHGPQPYTTHWFQEHIRRSLLPYYFFNESHLSLQRDTSELLHLGLSETDPIRPANAEDHLTVADRARDMFFPLSIQEGSDIHVLRQSVTDVQRHHLASRFPALREPDVSSNIILRGRGYIVLASQLQLPDIVCCADLPIIGTQDMGWTLSLTLPLPASFFEEDALPGSELTNGLSLANNDEVLQACDMTSMRAAQSDVIRRGGFVNPIRQIRGLGRYEWLQVYDQQLAQRRYLTLFAVVEQRTTGQLGQFDEPHVVWFPDSRFVNPASRPVGAGSFQYLTADDEELARLNLGGQQDNIMPDDPSAEDIWALRMRLATSERPDATREINLVWTPAAGDAGVVVNQNAGVVALVSDSEDEVTPNTSGWVVRPATASDCDPTNGARGTDIDQTGTPGKAEYWLATRNGEQIVADRSPAIRNQIEEHLFHIRGKRAWLRYKHADTMRWGNSNHIRQLNEFRSQNFRRGIYELMAREDCAKYTTEQNQWLTNETRNQLFDSASRGMETAKDLVRRFNAKFKTSREERGLGIKRSRILTKLRNESSPSDESLGHASKRQRVHSPKKLMVKNTAKGSVPPFLRDAVNSLKEKLSRSSLRSRPSQVSAAAATEVGDCPRQSRSDEDLDDAADLEEMSE